MDNNSGANEKLMELLIDKLTALDTNLNSIDKTLVKQEAQLAEHIRRTNALEAKLEPVEAHVQKVNGVFIFIGALSTILGILKLLNII